MYLQCFFTYLLYHLWFLEAGLGFFNDIRDCGQILELLVNSFALSESAGKRLDIVMSFGQVMT